MTMQRSPSPRSSRGIDRGPGAPSPGAPGTGMLEAPSFEEFVASSSAGLLRIAYLLTRDAQLAEDLLQTALAKAWPRWRQIRSDHRAYVRQAMVNTYASWWRRRWNGESPAADLPEEPTRPGHEHDLDLEAAIGRLPKRQRAVIVLRYFEDLTEGEVARMLDCSVGTVKSQTFKALRTLRIDPAMTVEDSTHADEGGTL